MKTIIVFRYLYYNQDIIIDKISWLQPFYDEMQAFLIKTVIHHDWLGKHSCVGYSWRSRGWKTIFGHGGLHFRAWYSIATDIPNILSEYKACNLHGTVFLFSHFQILSEYGHNIREFRLVYEDWDFRGFSLFHHSKAKI